MLAQRLNFKIVIVSVSFLFPNCRLSVLFTTKVPICLCLFWEIEILIDLIVHWNMDKIPTQSKKEQELLEDLLSDIYHR